MYSKILVPVDLANLEGLGKALATATDLGKHYAIPVVYVGVTAETPSSIAHNPHEFELKLKAFADGQAKTHGVETASMAIASHDPTVDLDDTLLKAINQSGADLVVMGSHRPGFVEHMFASNAGYIAMHAKVSVMIVR